MSSSSDTDPGTRRGKRNEDGDNPPPEGETGPDGEPREPKQEAPAPPVAKKPSKRLKMSSDKFLTVRDHAQRALMNFYKEIDALQLVKVSRTYVEKLDEPVFVSLLLPYLKATNEGLMDESAFPTPSEREFVLRFACHQLFDSVSLDGTLSWDSLLEFIIHWSDGLIERENYAKFFLTPNLMCLEKPSAIDGGFQTAYCVENIPRYGGKCVILLEAGLEESVQGGQVLRFVDPMTGKLRGTLKVPVPRAPILVQKEEDPGPTREVLSVQYLPYTNVLLTASNAKFLMCWDVDTNRPCKKIFLHDQKEGAQLLTFSHLHYSEEEKSVFLIEFEQGRVYRWYLQNVKWRAYNEDVWDIYIKDDPRIVPLTNGHGKPVLCCVMLTGKRMLATGCVDGSIILWDTISNAKKQHLSQTNGHSLGVKSLTFSPEKQLLISAGYDSRVIIWDPHAGTKISTLCEAGCSIVDICLLGFNNYVCAFDNESTCKIYDLNTLEQFQVFVADGVGKNTKGKSDLALGPIKCMCKISENRIMFAGSRVLFWDSTPEDPLVTSENPIPCFAYLPYPNQELALPVKTDIVVWDVFRGIPKRTLVKVCSNPVTALSSASEGKRFLVGSERGEVGVFLTNSCGMRLKSLAAHQTEIVAVEALNDVKRIVSLCAFKVIHVHDDTHDRKTTLLKKIEMNNCSFLKLSGIPHGNVIACPVQEGYVVWWSVAPIKYEAGEPPANHEDLDANEKPHNSPVIGCAFLESHPLLLTLDSEGVIVFWGYRKPLPMYSVHWKSNLEKHFEDNMGALNTTLNTPIKNLGGTSASSTLTGAATADGTGAVPPPASTPGGSSGRETSGFLSPEKQALEDEGPPPITSWAQLGGVTSMAFDRTHNLFYVGTDSGSVSKWSITELLKQVERSIRQRERKASNSSSSNPSSGMQFRRNSQISSKKEKEVKLHLNWLVSNAFGNVQTKGPVDLLQYGKDNLLFASNILQQTVYLLDASNGTIVGKLQKKLLLWNYPVETGFPHFHQMIASGAGSGANSLQTTLEGAASGANFTSGTTANNITATTVNEGGGPAGAVDKDAALVVCTTSAEQLLKIETDKINKTLSIREMVEMPETDADVEHKATELQDPELMMKQEKKQTAIEGSWREELRRKKKFSDKVPSMCSPERILQASQNRSVRLSRHSVFSDSSEYLGSMSDASNWKPPLKSGLKRGKRFEDSVQSSGDRLAEALDKIGAVNIAENFRSTRF